jgi:hypothetical protein
MHAAVVIWWVFSIKTSYENFKIYLVQVSFVELQSISGEGLCRFREEVLSWIGVHRTTAVLVVIDGDVDDTNGETVYIHPVTRQNHHGPIKSVSPIIDYVYKGVHCTVLL